MEGSVNFYQATRIRVDLIQTQTRPKSDPNQTQTIPKPDSNQTQTRFKPDPNQAQTIPKSDPNQTLLSDLTIKSYVSFKDDENVLVMNAK